MCIIWFAAELQHLFVTWVTLSELLSDVINTCTGFNKQWPHDGGSDSCLKKCDPVLSVLNPLTKAVLAVLFYRNTLHDMLIITALFTEINKIMLIKRYYIIMTNGGVDFTK